MSFILKSGAAYALRQWEKYYCEDSLTKKIWFMLHKLAISFFPEEVILNGWIWEMTVQNVCIPLCRRGHSIALLSVLFAPHMAAVSRKGPQPLLGAIAPSKGYYFLGIEEVIWGKGKSHKMGAVSQNGMKEFLTPASRFWFFKQQSMPQGTSLKCWLFSTKVDTTSFLHTYPI